MSDVERRFHETWLGIDVAELLARPANGRTRWLSDTHGFDKARARRIANAMKGVDADATPEGVAALVELLPARADRAAHRARPGQLVLQPGVERRRTSSHYTPRSLSEPIVRRTLEPPD